VLFAKNAYAHDRLRCQLKDGVLSKEYHAIVHGRPPFHDVIDAPIYNPPEATVKREIHPLGKPSVTEYFTEKEDGTLSLLRVIPRTGRTHQIRLHLSHIGHPIVSDFLYGEEHDGVLSRHGLHCSKLTFLQPVTGKEITVKAPLAPDMEAVVQSMVPREPYRSLDRYLKETFGEKLVKISLNGGLSCPNRKNDGRGCAFCSAGGSGEFAGTPQKSIEKQLADGKQLLSRKWKNCRYIAYFQAFTNTYGPVETLRRLYEQALADPDVAILSIATRPDCLPDDVLDLLEECNRKKPVWVELGLQTAKDVTAARLNRGYDRSVYESAVASLHQRNISVITHLIFGLPGESREDMLNSVEYAGRYTDGIKLQMLQILKGSVLGDTYLKTPFPLLSQEEYVSLVCDAIDLLPESVVIHRLTGDPPSDLLIAPQWTCDKKKVLAEIKKQFEKKMLLV
ncbi:MAG: TIGR01212 family radical SAM protein, partial [Clostridia bacterium]|nr:TIGR01212 family radical SAM protein [Clostridia bacterium]